MFGRFAGEFRIDIAIHFHTVFEVAPAIDDVVAIGVDEFAQHFAVRIAHHPAGLAFVLHGFHRAAGGLFGRGAIVVNVFLHRRELEGLLGSRRGRVSGRRRQSEHQPGEKQFHDRRHGKPSPFTAKHRTTAEQSSHGKCLCVKSRSERRGGHLALVCVLTARGGGAATRPCSPLFFDKSG